MEALLTCVHLATYVLLALAMPLPALRKPAILVALLTALVGLGAGFTGPAERTLETVHTYAGYAGNDIEVSMVRFPTGTVTAPGWQWPLPFAGFALLWIALLGWLGQRPLPRAWLWPILYGTSATAMWLGMQATAAPELLVQPVGLDRFLWPAGLAAALLAGRSASKFALLFLQVGSSILLMRLPAALFSKFVSDAHGGTCLDVTNVVDIVNPMGGMQFEPRLVSGSSAQQFWTIWLEHVIFFPAVHLMSLFGIAFAAWMFHRHGPETAR